VRNYILYVIFFGLSTLESLLNFLFSIFHIYPAFDFAMNFFNKYYQPIHSKDKAINSVKEYLENKIE